MRQTITNYKISRKAKEKLALYTGGRWGLNTPTTQKPRMPGLSGLRPASGGSAARAKRQEGWVGVAGMWFAFGCTCVPMQLLFQGSS